jgi:hypothetical protein
VLEAGAGMHGTGEAEVAWPASQPVICAASPDDAEDLRVASESRAHDSSQSLPLGDQGRCWLDAVVVPADASRWVGRMSARVEARNWFVAPGVPLRRSLVTRPCTPRRSHGVVMSRRGPAQVQVACGRRSLRAIRADSTAFTGSPRSVGLARASSGDLVIVTACPICQAGSPRESPIWGEGPGGRDACAPSALQSGDTACRPGDSITGGDTS